jgi:hypothetical protein
MIVTGLETRFVGCQLPSIGEEIDAAAEKPRSGRGAQPIRSLRAASDG